MSRTGKLSSEVSKRYAIALIDLAEEAKCVDKVESDVAQLLSMINDSKDLWATLRKPVISRANKKKALAAVARKAGFQKITSNFLGLTAQNGRAPVLESILAAVQDELARRRGELIASVTVAQDLSSEQIKALQDSLSRAEGKAVGVRVKVEPDILGGMIVKMGSRMIDDSVRGKLKKMQNLMESGSNQNNVKALSKAS